MKKIFQFLHENPKLLKPMAIGLFSSLFIIFCILAIIIIDGTLDINILLFFLVTIGLLTREYIISFFAPLKKIFPTDRMSEKAKKLLDKLFNWIIVVWFLGIGINPVNAVLQMKPITPFQLNYDILGISFCFLIIYI